jgi:succinyl-diaminopimelate desuccinylase
VADDRGAHADSAAPIDAVVRIDLSLDVVDLTAALIDIPSVSRSEKPLADAVEAALAQCAHLNVSRSGNTVIARTSLGRDQRIAIAGHLDTVPGAGNLPSRRDGERLYGLGACDMKGGLAVALRLAAQVAQPAHDVTYLFYDGEEIESEFNGLRLLAESSPDLLAADFAIVMEPSNGIVEGGCQGTVRVDVIVPGKAAHSARSWMGVNAIHAARDVLSRLANYEPREPVVDGLRFHEGLNAVGIHGGVAGNVIPPECVVSVNYRFAPDRSEDEAIAHLREVFAGYAVVVTDSAPAARPGLDAATAASFVEAMGGRAEAKLGWTDVARFAALGVPGVNFGPGDPLHAHQADEFVKVGELRACETAMRTWLTGP